MLFELRDLEVAFENNGNLTHAVNGVSLAVDEGEALGVVGESGSGKSVSMLSALRLLPAPPARITGGAALFAGEDMTRMPTRRIRRLNGAAIGMVFQDPRISLNPVLSIGRQLTEPLRLHRGLSARQARIEAVRLLELVQLPDPERQLKRYPHELSGGMCQRVLIAIALSCNPRLLIADEPTTALDVTIQAQIVRLVNDIRRARRMAVIWITHDLALLRGLVERVAIMYGGRVVEEASIDTVFTRPAHPYTRRLLAAAPTLDQPRGLPLTTIEGVPPVLRAKPVGCTFAPRCPRAAARCRSETPVRENLGGGHHVACWYPETQALPA